MVNVPKTRRTFCDGKCRRHTMHKVTQYKKGKESRLAQGRRRYDSKQKGFGGQTKPIFRKKAKTTKKIVLRMECTECKHRKQLPIKRCKHFELGGQKKTRGQIIFRLTNSPMVVTIAYRDKPGDVLYSFLKAGDSISIGRDKRQCGIALGVDAQGVSRVHLKLELLSSGCLLARDTSTYGTGYDGGPLVLEREKELKPSVILQIGSFFFVIKEKKAERKNIEEAITDRSWRIPEVYNIQNTRKRTASIKTAVVAEEECVHEKKRIIESVVNNLAHETTGSEEKATNSIETRNEFSANVNSSLSTDATWIKEQDKKLVAKLGMKVKEEMDRMDSKRIDYYRRIADFLISDDEDDKSEVSIFHMADSPPHIFSTGTSVEYDSSKTRFVTSNTHLSLRKKYAKDASEASNTGKSVTSFFPAEQISNFLGSKGMNEAFLKRRGSCSFQTVLPESGSVPSEEIVATGFTSLLDENGIEKRKNRSGYQNIAEEALRVSKRAKIEIMENENGIRESLENMSSTENETKHEVNDSQNDQHGGMNIEVLRMKLKKTVQYDNLERPILAKDKLRFVDATYLTNEHSEEPNYKRFKKAPQGSHGCGSLLSEVTRVIGGGDLIDFREIA
uniref:FHA domain-containing protein n=1 Tax=Setaria digitata TaxID=48799 RepID=A0A915PZ00_9BILA